MTSRMSEEQANCDLCCLPVEIPDFELRTKDGVRHFCCEGCMEIYRMLHESEIVDETDPSPVSEEDRSESE